MRFGIRGLCLLWVVLSTLLFPSFLSAEKGLMGQLELRTYSKPVRSCGVWIDGEYVGYVGELQGSNRLKLLPGSHQVVVRGPGYADFSQDVVIEPRKLLSVHVVMYKDAAFVAANPKTAARVRIDATPGEAAIFVDDRYFGTVDQYYGIDHAMLLTPGQHRFKIALPGFKAYQAELTLLPRQNLKLQASLYRASINDADAAVRKEPLSATSATTDSGASASR